MPTREQQAKRQVIWASHGPCIARCATALGHPLMCRTRKDSPAPASFLRVAFVGMKQQQDNDAAWLIWPQHVYRVLQCSASATTTNCGGLYNLLLASCLPRRQLLLHSARPFAIATKRYPDQVVTGCDMNTSHMKKHPWPFANRLVGQKITSTRHWELSRWSRRHSLA